MKGCHVEVMLGTIDQAVEYCQKDMGDQMEYVTFFESGVRPLSNDNKGRAEKLRWKRALDLSKAGDIDAIDADIQFRYYPTILKLRLDYALKPVPLADVTGEWRYGLTGHGKTRGVFEDYPDCYIKSRNKWWSSYRGQDVVLLDDLGHNDAKWIGDFLKDWAGQFPFQAETKGAGMQIRPKKFIVTSQYQIEELWYDKETIDALKRRFKCIHIFDITKQ